MKHVYLGYLLGWLGLLAGCPVLAQTLPGSVGIGTASPDASAVLDLTATNKGLLIPRLDSARRVAIAAPAAGLLVFQTGPQRQGFYYYGGSGWLFLPDKARTGDNLGSGVATTALNLQGNALTGTGADLGTTIGLGVRADGGLNIGQNPSQNLFVGYQAGQANADGGYNQFIGIQAGQANTDGYDNYFSGFQSGYANLTGHNNQFIGTRTGYANTTGSYNTILGSYSGYANTLGTLNTFIGASSGNNTTTGSHNTFSGAQSGYYTTRGSDNTFSGFNSGLDNTTGSSNTFTGAGSGGLTTTASNNTFTGVSTGRYNTTGTGNVFDGYHSGYNNTTGSYNAALGYGSGPASGSGDITNATAVGANVVLTQSNTVVLGSGAKVGIGTSSPGQQLEVAGQVFSSAGGFQFPDHTVQATAATAAGFVQNTTTPQAGASFNVGGSGTIGGNAVVGGRLGLGTSTPSEALDVRGNLRLGADGGTATGAGQAVEFVGPGFNADAVGLYRQNTGSGTSELRLVVGSSTSTTAGDRLVLGTSAATAPGQLSTAAFTPHLTVLSSGALVYGTQLIPLDRVKGTAKPGETIPARTVTPHAALLLNVGPSLPIGGSNAPILLDPSGAVTGQQVLVTNLDSEVLPVQYAGGSVSLPQYTTARFLFANGHWTREL